MVKETIDSIRNLFPYFDTNPVGRCAVSIDSVRQILSRRNINYNVFEGTFAGENVEGGEGINKHWFVKIPHEVVDDADNGVIIDLTVKQFTEDNFKNERIVQSYVPSSEIPDTPVITSNDNIYKAYEESKRPGIY